MMTASDYQNLYATAKLDPAKAQELQAICATIIANYGRYKSVSYLTSIPWFCVAAIHFRESNSRFTCHLHNGDPLSARTVHVPANRPTDGQPPFTWEQSATDALKGIWRPLQWNLPGALEFMERYNGVGYQKHSVNTPYLWDYTDKYTSGLFVADGSFDANKRESRPGCVAILKTLEAKGVNLDFLTPISDPQNTEVLV